MEARNAAVTMRNWKRLGAGTAWKSHRNWRLKAATVNQSCGLQRYLTASEQERNARKCPQKQLLSAPEIISIGPLQLGSPNGAARAKDATADGEQRQLQGLMGEPIMASN